MFGCSRLLACDIAEFCRLIQSQAHQLKWLQLTISQLEANVRNQMEEVRSKISDLVLRMDIWNTQIERLGSEHNIFVQIIPDSARRPNTSEASPRDQQLKKMQSTRSSSLWELMKLLKGANSEPVESFQWMFSPAFMQFHALQV